MNAREEIVKAEKLYDACTVGYDYLMRRNELKQAEIDGSCTVPVHVVSMEQPIETAERQLSKDLQDFTKIVDELILLDHPDIPPIAREVRCRNECEDLLASLAKMYSICNDLLME